jgi:AraC-like DNA-binding protein
MTDHQVAPPWFTVDTGVEGDSRVVTFASGTVTRERLISVGASPRGSERGLVAAARRRIGEGHPAANGLFPLAALLGVSPYRLSRASRRELGVSLTRYRNRVRVARALDRVEAGEPHLGILAADLGFADQRHTCPAPSVSTSPTHRPCYAACWRDPVVSRGAHLDTTIL